MFERSHLTYPTDILPLAPFRRAKTSYSEWKAYMEDMRDETATTLENGNSKNDASLLGKLQ